MIDKILAGLATIAGVGGYYLPTLTDWILTLSLGIAVAVFGTPSAFIGALLIKHNEPRLAAMLIQGWRLMLFVMMALAETIAGLYVKHLFPDPNASALAFVVAGAAPALGTFGSGPD